MSAQDRLDLALYRSAYRGVYEGKSQNTPSEVHPIPGVNRTAADRALARLWDRHLRVAFGVVRNAGFSVNDDVVITAFSDALHRKSFAFNLDSDTVFQTWFAGVVLNGVRDAHRKIKRSKEVTETSRMGEKGDLLPSVFDVDHHEPTWTSHSEENPEMSEFSRALLRTVERFASERFPETAAVIMDIAARQFVLPALGLGSDEQPAQKLTRGIFEREHGLTPRSIRTQEKRAKELLQEAATNLIEARV